MSHYIWNLDNWRATRISEYMTTKLGYLVSIKIRNVLYDREDGTFNNRPNLHNIEIKFDSYHTVWIAPFPGQCGVLIGYCLSSDGREKEVLSTIARILYYRTVMVSHIINNLALASYTDYESIWEAYNTHSGNTIQIRATDVGPATEEEEELIKELWPPEEEDMDYDDASESYDW